MNTYADNRQDTEADGLVASGIKGSLDNAVGNVSVDALHPHIRVAEMFAGVGGFRVGFDDANVTLSTHVFDTVWANQWEPDGRPTKQFAWKCYEVHYGTGSCVNEDVAKVLDEVEAGTRTIPKYDLLCGGFPCQAFSTARPRSRSLGLADVSGGKGLLWWQIDRMMRITRPSYALFENVDRLLKSPTTNRGRDFATILACLADMGYSVEWHVVNAADYGNPQKRRRVFIWCERQDVTTNKQDDTNDIMLMTAGELLENGLMSKALPVSLVGEWTVLTVPSDPQEAFGMRWADAHGHSPFLAVGAMTPDGSCVTCNAISAYDGPRRVLADILVPDDDVPEPYYVTDAEYPKWQVTREAKRIPRVSKDGHEYVYSEGRMACPDPTDEPARTILTGGGGRAASRMKHIIATGRDDTDHRYRRLVPDELDVIQCFPKGWTNVAGLTDTQRAFCMGNALVTDIPRRIGVALAGNVGRKK